MLEENFEMMKGWVKFCEQTADDCIRGNFGYGDWLNVDDTPRDLLATAYFYYSAYLLRDTCDIFGKAAERERFAARGNHLSCGFIGIIYFCPVLSDLGRNDLSVQLLLNETYPSRGLTNDCEVPFGCEAKFCLPANRMGLLDGEAPIPSGERFCGREVVLLCSGMYRFVSE